MNIPKRDPGPWRWLAGCFSAFGKITAIFAAHPAGPLPPEQVTTVETEYMSYREKYNRRLDQGLFVFWSHVHIVQGQGDLEQFFCCTAYVSDWGLALWALAQSRLLFPVRPKMHSLEHLILGIHNGLKFAWPPRSWSAIYHLSLRIFDFVPLKGNPRYYQCLLDEDMIRRELWLHAWFAALHLVFFLDKICLPKVKAIVQYIHPNVFASRALQHYCVAICMRWVRGVHVREDVQWKSASSACPNLPVGAQLWDGGVF